MQDGRTRKLQGQAPRPGGKAFFQRHRVALVTLTGTTAGNEYLLESANVSVGRGSEAGLRFDDAAMSREHAVFEVSGDGFRVRDLGSTNGLLVNGHPSLCADLKHGDKVQVGEHLFQYLVEEGVAAPRAYVLDDL